MKDARCLLAVLLSTMLIFLQFVPHAFALSQASVDEESLEFNIQEEIGNNKEIIRVYQNNLSQRRMNYSLASQQDEAKKLLIALGLTEKTVNKMSEDDLQTVFNSPHITSIVSYIKYTEDNCAIYLDEETALSEVANISTRHKSNANSRTIIAEEEKTKLVSLT